MAARGLQRCFNIYDLRELARRRLPLPIFSYMDGGSDDEETLQRNIGAFSDYELIPRILVDVEHIDMKTRVLGVVIDW
ncbi:MAG: alpha-hydroxy-acid oxidizing protein, partial [Proteobacteria bacterium]|nr:alpha-hydroxy-acid oxidizing protein [Pseudomonadota bacterium]